MMEQRSQIAVLPTARVKPSVGETYLIEQLDGLGRLAAELGYVEASHFITVAQEAIAGGWERGKSL